MASQRWPSRHGLHTLATPSAYATLRYYVGKFLHQVLSLCSMIRVCFRLFVVGSAYRIVNVSHLYVFLLP